MKNLIFMICTGSTLVGVMIFTVLTLFFVGPEILAQNGSTAVQAHNTLIEFMTILKVFGTGVIGSLCGVIVVLFKRKSALHKELRHQLADKVDMVEKYFAKLERLQRDTTKEMTETAEAVLNLSHTTDRLRKTLPCLKKAAEECQVIEDEK